MMTCTELSRSADMEAVPLRPAQRIPMNVLLQRAARRISEDSVGARAPNFRQRILEMIAGVRKLPQAWPVRTVT